MSTESIESAVPDELPPIKQTKPSDILRWLKLGWQDTRKAGFPSLFHGIVVSVVCLSIINFSQSHWEWVVIAASCFLMVGPFLATGLYALSRDISAGRAPSMKHAYCAWCHASRCLSRFSMLLMFVCFWWVLISLLLFHWFVDVSIENPMDFIQYVLTQHDGLFMLWNILGGMVAALVFGMTVAAVPMLVHKNVNTWEAVRTSIRAVGQNPITMVWWAMTLLFLSGLGFLTATAGFIILYPLMGHASWHAYRDLVDAEGLPGFPNQE